MLDNSTEVDEKEELSAKERQKEAWLAMLKRTGQELNTPIGR